MNCCRVLAPFLVLINVAPIGPISVASWTALGPRVVSAVVVILAASTSDVFSIWTALMNTIFVCMPCFLACATIAWALAPDIEMNRRVSVSSGPDSSTAVKFSNAELTCFHKVHLCTTAWHVGCIDAVHCSWHDLCAMC